MSLLAPPINYTGSKYRLMNQLLDYLPQGCETFYDFFGGSACVSLNMAEYSNSIVYNDRDTNLVNLMQYLYSEEGTKILQELYEVISKWGLGEGCKDEFHTYRDYFNLDTFGRTSAEFLALIFHSFSSSIRYNITGTRITSSAGGDQAFFRKSHEPRILKAAEAMKQTEMRFTNLDLFALDFEEPQKYDLVYLDPPYLASGKTMYSHFWGEEHEKYLLSKLRGLDSRGVDFALSNVLYSKGHVNELLIEFSKDFNIIDLNKHYKNSSYHDYSSNSLPTREVLITNF